MDVFKIRFLETAASAFLAWLLNPKETHSFGDYFLKYFLIEAAKISEEFSVLYIDNLDLSEAIIKTEENFYGKKVDITIRISNEKHNFLCLIENKINSSESEEQTTNYVKLSRRKYEDHNIMYIFLTPEGDDAGSVKFIPINYYTVKNLIKQTIEAFHDNINEEIIFLLKQFNDNLEVNVLKEGRISELCNKIYERHKKAIEVIVDNKTDFMKEINNFIKDNLDLNIWDTYKTKSRCYVFKKQWIDQFADHSLKYLPFFYYRVVSWVKEGNLKIDVDFCIHRLKNNEKQIRERFIKILDQKFSQNALYSTKNVSRKFKKSVFQTGYDTTDELRDVSNEMIKLIKATEKNMDTAIDQLYKSLSEF